jgi:hypothetical protein
MAGRARLAMVALAAMSFLLPGAARAASASGVETPSTSAPTGFAPPTSAEAAPRVEEEAPPEFPKDDGDWSRFSPPPLWSAAATVLVLHDSLDSMRLLCDAALPANKRQIDYAYFSWELRNAELVDVSERLWGEHAAPFLAKLDAQLASTRQDFAEALKDKATAICGSLATRMYSGEADFGKKSPDDERRLRDYLGRHPASPEHQQDLADLSGCMKANSNKGMNYDFGRDSCPCVIKASHELLPPELTRPPDHHVEDQEAYIAEHSTKMLAYPDYVEAVKACVVRSSARFSPFLPQQDEPAAPAK